MKGLGESDSDDGGALSWVKKNRKQQKDKELAEKRVIFGFCFYKFRSQNIVINPFLFDFIESFSAVYQKHQLN